MERTHHQFMVGFVVHHTGADQPLMGRCHHAVVHGLLQGEGLGFQGREPVSPVVNGQAQPVALGVVGQVERAERVRQIG
jgi:hypothetical protein